jgi:hypothetical protein
MKQPDEDRWLDAAFSALPEVTVPADLRRRIAEIPIVHPRQARLPWLHPVSASLWWSLCGALGILCGVYLDIPGQTSGWVEAPTVARDASSLEEELLTAAFASPLGADWNDTWGDAMLAGEEEAP